MCPRIAPWTHMHLSPSTLAALDLLADAPPRTQQEWASAWSITRQAVAQRIAPLRAAHLVDLGATGAVTITPRGWRVVSLYRALRGEIEPRA